MQANTTIDIEDVERFSRIAEEWWDENGKFRPLHQINPVRLKYIINQACGHFGRNSDNIKSLDGLKILDIGCGGGLMSEPMARLGGEVSAIDASEKNIKVAKLHAEKMGLSINYLCSTPEELAKTEEKYDIILALEVVEHVSDVELFIKSCVSLLKPNGIIFMSTINRTIKSYLLAIIGAEYIMRWLPRGTHDWNKFLKPSELCGYLRNEKLTVNNMTGMAFNPLKNIWYLDEKDLAVNYLLNAVN